MQKFVLMFAVIFCGRTLSAQAVSFGVKGGIAVSDLNAYQDESKRYIVGPTIEIRLPSNFAIEIDALYRRVGNSLGFAFILSGTNLVNAGSNSFFTRDRGNSWQFPFLGKYYFRPDTAWQPFVGTGLALRATWFQSDASGPGTQSHFSYTDGPDVGAVVAAGVRFHRGRFAFAPEARYTRWGGSNHDRNSRDEGGILLGISF